MSSDLWDNEIDFLPIVVGFHLDAEMHDRPRASRLIEAVRRWQHAYCDEPICRPVVVTDALYFTSETLARGGVISFGRPSVNALSASLAEQLPVVHSRGGRIVIQADLNGSIPRLCLWGEGRRRSDEILDRLIDVELDEFLRAMAARAALI